MANPSQRIRIDPTYALDLVNASWLKSSLAISASNSFYARSLDPQTGAIIDEPVSLQYQTMQINLHRAVIRPDVFRLQTQDHAS